MDEVPDKIILSNDVQKKYVHTKDVSVKSKPSSIKNPQSNAIIDRAHQVVGDMLRTHDLNE